jgi:hypothetical protein
VTSTLPKRGDVSKGRALGVSNVFSPMTNRHAIARISDAYVEHLGNVQRSLFTKVGIEKVVPTICIVLQALSDCSQLSFDVENTLYTVFRRRFLTEL